MGIDPDRHPAYRQLIAQSIGEMRRVLVNALAPVASEHRIRQLEEASQAAIALADAVIPLAHASADQFAEFDQVSFWSSFDAALQRCGEFDHYPPNIRRKRRASMRLMKGFLVRQEIGIRPQSPKSNVARAC